MPSLKACIQCAFALLSVHAAALPAPSDTIAVRDAPSDIGSEIAAIASMAWGITNNWKAPQGIDKLQQDSTCSLADIKLPKRQSNSLWTTPTTTPHTDSFPATAPLPAANGTLRYVALGRGTQNYTCAASNKDTKPVAAGALATLWDMSCASSRFQPAINTLAPLSLALPPPPPPSTANGAAYMGMQLLGHHYFAPGATPTFNLKTARGDAGFVALDAAGKVPAPPLAPRGADGLGHGAVDWLALRAKPGPQGAPGQPSFQNVFRVNTAGGNPPATCDGLDSAFQVQYAAEYWFFQ